MSNLTAVSALNLLPSGQKSAWKSSRQQTPVPENHIAIAVPSMRKMAKIIFNLLKIKKIYFQVAFCYGRGRMIKNILKDRKIEN
ncbi:hypothetical protein [Eikenella corrodens]|uniref:hypothetical protein n=1 Tax=Eikenella corrodens TaxID=539 RepID=UPI0009C1207E|nr:hypothetical protein [Eikenella corrodens]